MTASRRHMHRALLAGLLVTVAACGSGSESGEEPRNAAISTRSPDKPQRGTVAVFNDSGAVQHDPVSKRTVALSTFPVRDSLHTGSIGLIDVNDPWNEAVPSSMPIIQGSIYAVEPDGSGGWYLGGTIRGVGSQVFESPRYLVRIGADGVMTSFDPMLAALPGSTLTAVKQIWLDATIGKLVVSTIGIMPPRHFRVPDGATVEQTHQNSIRVMDPATGADVTANHFPAVSGEFGVSNVVNGVAYIESIYDQPFGRSLDGVNRNFVEAVDLRTKAINIFGSRFYADTCTARALCSKPSRLLPADTGLIASFVSRTYAANNQRLTESVWVKTSTAGITGAPIAPVSYDALQESLKGWTVVGGNLYVAVCGADDASVVRGYSLATGVRFSAGARPSDAVPCQNHDFVRIGDDIYVTKFSDAGTRLVRVSKTTLKEETGPFTRSVDDGSGRTVTENFAFVRTNILQTGRRATGEITVSGGRAWVASPYGLSPKFARSNLLITDENGSPIVFDDGLSDMNMRAESHFQIRDGWLYALAASTVDPIAPMQIMRWNLTTLERDSSWSVTLPFRARAFAVGETAVLAHSVTQRDRYTAIDLQTGFSRFTFTVPVANDMERRTFVVDGDTVWTTGLFNSDAGQHAVARLNMQDGSVRLSAVEPSWCTPAQRQCLAWAQYDATRRLPLVASGQHLYTFVSGQLTRVDKSTMETVKGPRGPYLTALSGLAVVGDQIFAYDTTARQVTRFLLPSMEARGAIGAPLPLSAMTESTSIVTGLTGTATRINLVLRHPVALNSTTFGSGIVAMGTDGLLVPGLRNAIWADSVVTAQPVDPVAGQVAVPVDAREVVSNDASAFSSGRVVVTRVVAGHRSLTVRFVGTPAGSTHRVVDRTGATRCTTVTDSCVIRNISPATALSLSVVPDGNPGAASEFTVAIKPSFVMKKGATARTSGIVRPGKAKATWTVRGGCRLNGARTSLTAPKKPATCTVRVKGGKGSTAYDFSARVVVQ